jgi:hypothetical protein
MTAYTIPEKCKLCPHCKKLRGKYKMECLLTGWFDVTENYANKCKGEK